MVIGDLYNATVEVREKTRTRTAIGGWDETFSAKYARVPCRIQPMGGGEQFLYRRETTEITHKMFCDATWAIVEQNRVVGDDGTVYDVQLVRDIDRMGHHLEIELRRLREAI